MDAGVHLPPLPAELARACGGPDLTAGANAKAALARSLLDLARCRRKHLAAVRFYEAVRNEFGGAK